MLALVVFLGFAFVYTIALSCARMAAIADHRAAQSAKREERLNQQWVRSHWSAKSWGTVSQPPLDESWAVGVLMGHLTSTRDEMEDAKR